MFFSIHHDISHSQKTDPLEDLQYLLYNYIGCPSPAEKVVSDEAIDSCAASTKTPSWRLISGNRKSVLSQNLWEKIKSKEQQDSSEAPPMLTKNPIIEDEDLTENPIVAEKKMVEQDNIPEDDTPTATKMAANRTRRRLSISKHNAVATGTVVRTGSVRRKTKRNSMIAKFVKRGSGRLSQVESWDHLIKVIEVETNNSQSPVPSFERKYE